MTSSVGLYKGEQCEADVGQMVRLSFPERYVILPEPLWCPPWQGTMRRLRYDLIGHDGEVYGLVLDRVVNQSFDREVLSNGCLCDLPANWTIWYKILLGEVGLVVYTQCVVGLEADRRDPFQVGGAYPTVLTSNGGPVK